MNEYTVSSLPPTAVEHRTLREAVGWGNPVNEEATARALAGSLAVFTLRLDGKPVGVARVIGDGGAAFYIQDVIVHPEHQGRGGGRLLMEAVMGWLRKNAPSGAFVGLMANGGKEPFYEKFGFVSRPRVSGEHVHGHGMEMRMA